MDVNAVFESAILALLLKICATVSVFVFSAAKARDNGHVKFD
jgi:hypothetical protein